MAYSTFGRSFKHGSIQMVAGWTVTVTTDAGDLSWSVPKPVVQQIQRGDLSSAGSHPIAGPEEPISLTFTVIVTAFATASSTVATPWGVMTGASGFTSVGATGEVHQFQLVFAITDPAGGATETITFAKCFLDGSIDFAEGEPDTLTANCLDWETNVVLT
jgi:hypothetical protein